MIIYCGQCVVGTYIGIVVEHCAEIHGTVRKHLKNKNRNRLAENEKNLVESRMENWSFVFVDQNIIIIVLEGKIIYVFIVRLLDIVQSRICVGGFLPHTNRERVGRRYFIKLGQQQSYQRDCALWPYMYIHMMRNKHFFIHALLLLALQQQVWMGVGPYTLVYYYYMLE